MGVNLQSISFANITNCGGIFELTFVENIILLQSVFSGLHVCMHLCILHPYIFIYSPRQLYYYLYVTDEKTESQHSYSRSCLTYSKLHLEKAGKQNLDPFKI